jgi:hypothetical protein
MADEFNLNRFVSAQAPVYDAALRELDAGEKTSHWMWFVFPQLRGLGRSSTASFYGIASEAGGERSGRNDPQPALAVIPSRLQIPTTEFCGART